MFRKLYVAAVAASLVALPLSAQVGKSLTVLEANTAPVGQIAALPGMTAAIAGEVTAARPFVSPLALDAFLTTRLSADQRTAIRSRLWVHINLNTASRDEIMLIPGMGPRMRHEFEEYRPYRGIAQFRREMGKYVDAEEVARLEQYVFVPLDLNTASDEDLLTIPGLGARMLHEFKEYRPYRGIEQFRREIGKYVDAAEVARLERYVEIREP